MHGDVIVVETEKTIRAGHIEASEDDEVVGLISEDEEWYDHQKARIAAQNFKNSSYDLFLTVEWLASGTQRVEGV